ncbi:SWIM zinc finger family protein [uncultured Friedmanniella sp.]|uniref:SWIM zinc finger family protein n=1 Tax=uncultured Friedmanniella sp. TaxID=335381 RepID=UPI0035CB7A2D
MQAAEQRSGAWDRTRVLALAPDDSAQRAASAVPSSSWQELGCTDRSLLWGVCRGSGSRPYEVVVDPAAPAYGCSCPSRKSPCKHALALLLRWSAGDLPEGAPTAFAERWRSGRAGPAAEAVESRPAGTLADPAAAAARAVARRQRVSDGLDELSVWLGDQLRGGLAQMERAGYAAVDTVAARMVDAQAPGVTSLLRALPAELTSEGWPGRVLEQLAALHLLVQAHRSLDALPDGLAATVRARIGYPTAKAEVLAGPGVDDEWWAVGQLDAVEARLETRRVWLWGRHSRRWALWLTFAVPGQAPDSTVTAGERLLGRLHYYPGSGQYRVVVGERRDAADLGELAMPPAESVPQSRARFAALLAADPWANRMPAVLRVTPVPPERTEPWRLRDGDGWYREVVGPELSLWSLLAESRGREVAVVVEWTDAGVRPLAVLDDAAARHGAVTAVRAVS